MVYENPKLTQTLIFEELKFIVFKESSDETLHWIKSFPNFENPLENII